MSLKEVASTPPQVRGAGLGSPQRQRWGRLPGNPWVFGGTVHSTQHVVEERWRPEKSEG